MYFQATVIFGHQHYCKFEESYSVFLQSTVFSKIAKSSQNKGIN